MVGSRKRRRWSRENHGRQTVRACRIPDWLKNDFNEEIRYSLTSSRKGCDQNSDRDRAAIISVSENFHHLKITSNCSRRNSAAIDPGCVLQPSAGSHAELLIAIPAGGDFVIG